MVNNAGIAVVGSFLDHSEADCDAIVGINLLGLARGVDRASQSGSWARSLAR